MSMTEIVKVFGERNIRSFWDDVAEEWYFSVVDVVAVLTESANPRNYWKVLKNRLKKEGNESVTNCNQLKLKAADGKFYKTDVATPEQMFRLIQSIPSPKAEPFKLWMAKVAAERLNQLQDPELSIQQALADYRRLGYSERWIARRVAVALPRMLGWRLKRRLGVRSFRHSMQMMQERLMLMRDRRHYRKNKTSRRLCLKSLLTFSPPKW